MKVAQNLANKKKKNTLFEIFYKPECLKNIQKFVTLSISV